MPKTAGKKTRKKVKARKNSSRLVAEVVRWDKVPEKPPRPGVVRIVRYGPKCPRVGRPVKEDEPTGVAV